MNYFQSTRISLGLFLILIYVCDCSVKEDTVPVIIPSKDVQTPDAQSKFSYDRRQSNSRIHSSSTLAPPESSKSIQIYTFESIHKFTFKKFHLQDSHISLFSMLMHDS